MRQKIYPAQMKKYLIQIIKEIININNQMQVAILTKFNLSFIVDSVQDFGFSENI